MKSKRTFEIHEVEVSLKNLNYSIPTPLTEDWLENQLEELDLDRIHSFSSQKRILQKFCCYNGQY